MQRIITLITLCTNDPLRALTFDYEPQNRLMEVYSGLPHRPVPGREDCQNAETMAPSKTYGMPYMPYIG